MYKRILVTTDGSALSKKAVASAVGLARATGADLVALHVVPRYPTAYFEGGISLATSEVKRIEGQWAEKGQAIVDGVKAAAEAAGVKTRTAIARSDLIVMASHGRKGLKRLLLGSETQHVLTHSNVPVLVLR